MRLRAVSPEALALGLVPGLTLADARARVPGLAVVSHDPVRDAELLMHLADDCDRVTPMVAPEPPDGLILDITGCAHLFGGEAALRERLLARIARAGVAARAAIAGTPDAARALARFGGPAIVAPGEEAGAVRSLSVAALEQPEEVRLALTRAGLKRIGDLADRPPRPLAARFGEGLTVKLARVLGQEDRHIVPRRPVPVCLVEQSFAEPIGRTEDIEATLDLLLRRAADILLARGEGGRAFEAAFFRTDGAVRRIRVDTGRPLRDAAAVMRLFRERIEALADPLDPGFGFDLVRLCVPAAEPLGPAQTRFDGKAAGEEEVADLIDRLAARFGRDRVLRFQPEETHNPSRASGLHPITGAAVPPIPWTRPEPGEPPLRPLQVFSRPQPVEALAEMPDGPPRRFRWRRVLHEVARAEGPERIAGEWWRGAFPSRDYYRIEDSAGRRFWLFRVDGTPEAPHPRWYLHGLFA